jgi:hypothetical protein
VEFPPTADAAGRFVGAAGRFFAATGLFFFFAAAALFFAAAEGFFRAAERFFAAAGRRFFADGRFFILATSGDKRGTLTGGRRNVGRDVGWERAGESTANRPLSLRALAGVLGKSGP